VFDEVGARNVRWVFSINSENIPPENVYTDYYPGDRYVDYIGLDGYNWGAAQSWSRWRSFKEIFSGIYRDVIRRYKKPVILSEFSSSSAGGDKVRWGDEALREIRKMPEVKGFVLFNVDKETDWRFPPDAASGQKLKVGLKAPYFLEAGEGKL
jgi:beta-mannanase